MALGLVVLLAIVFGVIIKMGSSGNGRISR